MDDFAYMFLSGAHDDGNGPAADATPKASPGEAPTPGAATHDTAPQGPVDPVVPKTPETPHRRRGLRDIFSKANLQDQLLDKLFHQVIPLDGLDEHEPGADAGTARDDASFAYGDDSPDAFAEAPKPRPGFSVAVMSNNFRRFNARIGVVFRFQKRVERLLAWRRPSHTLSLLGAYTLVCLDPYLLTLLPPAVALLAVLVPAFVARHPGEPSTSASALRRFEYARGPPLAPPRTVKPVKELSRDFFRNMGDLQNCMEDFSVAHDAVIGLVVPATNFSDEAQSSALFVLLCAAAALLSVAAHLLPWRLLALVGGWAAIVSGHPAVARAMHAWRTTAPRAPTTQDDAKPDAKLDAKPDAQLDTKLDAVTPAAVWSWFAGDIVLDEPAETREVEIFELQRRSDAAAEWEPWVFSPSPYDPLSPPRLAPSARPVGARFFEDVLPPRGWEWSEKKWALDLWSRDWVEERIITGVEVETEGERWVYDIYTEAEQQKQKQQFGDFDFDLDLHDTGGLHPIGRTPRLTIGPGWEEADSDECEGLGRRGAWRRRRWVRTVKRTKIAEEA